MVKTSSEFNVIVKESDSVCWVEFHLRTVSVFGVYDARYNMTVYDYIFFNKTAFQNKFRVCRMFYYAVYTFFVIITFFILDFD